MADLLIFVEAMFPVESSSNVKFTGHCRTSDMTDVDSSIYWEVAVNPSGLASTMNTAIKNAAVSAADGEGHTVGVLDKKTVFAGATGL